ncbi:MAG: hypothetical protein QM831_31590 [Kofleriaceae bacterium]
MSHARADGLSTAIRIGAAYNVFDDTTIDRSPNGFGPVAAFVGFRFEHVTAGFQLGYERYANDRFHDDLTGKDFAEQYDFFNGSGRVELELGT